MHHSHLFDVPECPNQKTVYHLLPKERGEDYYRERTDRNIGWITAEEQVILKRSAIGIAGCGGMGAQLAEKFLRLGIGEIRIADTEVFDISNINRQFAATRKTVGVSKAFATAAMLRDISDDSTIDVYPMGICEESVLPFLMDCAIVCDEIEFWAVGSRILLHREARRQKIPIFNCNTIGFGTRLFLFTHESVTMEECLGLSYEEAVDLQTKIEKRLATSEEVRRVQECVMRGLLPELPEYCAPDSSVQNLQMLHDRLFNERKASIIATNPPLATGLLADRALLYLLQDSGVKRAIPKTPPMPGYLYFDAAKMESRIITERWW